jgi:hypothetical protein
MQTQRTCHAWGHYFACGFVRVILDRVRDNLDPVPGSRNWGSELDADAEFNADENHRTVIVIESLNFRASYHTYLVYYCGVVENHRTTLLLRESLSC